MTKFKEYLRVNGVSLACDYESLPCDDVKYVLPRVLDNGIEVINIGVNSTDTRHIMFNRHGECFVFRSYEELVWDV